MVTGISVCWTLGHLSGVSSLESNSGLQDLVCIDVGGGRMMMGKTVKINWQLRVLLNIMLSICWLNLFNPENNSMGWSPSKFNSEENLEVQRFIYAAFCTHNDKYGRTIL